ncbi:MAG: hypothetical protein P1P90_03915 [Patescibacteria group bacterium]|nr:hypothetical protein [Patescibacteria group bacterium]
MEKFQKESIPQDIYESNPITDLESAIKAGDADLLFSIIAKIDRTLTGALSGTFNPTAPDATGPEVIQEIQEFVAKFSTDPDRASLKIYLGDSGMSRLMLRGTEDGKLEADLSPVSSASAKTKWAKLIS